MDQITLNSSEIFVEGIRIVSRPIDTDQGIQSLTPFVISISAETSNYEELRLNLYVSNTNSIPYTSELDNNWSALKPQWRFLDISGNYIEEQAIIDYHTEVLDENGDIRGAIGTVSFYYVDDLPSDYGCPSMITITLDLLNYYDKDYVDIESEVISFYNSDIKIIAPFYVYPIIPSFIHFSKNGNIDLYPAQWAGNNINAYATIHGSPRNQFVDYDQCAVDYPILFNVPASASDGSTNILHYTIYPLTGSEISPSGALSAEFDVFDTSNAAYTGGWTEVNVTSLVESDGAILSGFVDISYDPDDYYTDTTSELWVSNIKSNMLHKLQSIYLDYTKACISGIYGVLGDKISENVFNTGFSVPFYEPSAYNISADILSNVNELSGQSAIYGIAIDGEQNVWHVDFELDRIYKRDSAGELEFTIDLQKLEKGVEIGYPYYDSEYTWYGPNSISIDSNNNAYVTLFNSISGIKISQDGDIDGYFAFSEAFISGFPLSAEENSKLSPIDIEIDANDNIHVCYTSQDETYLVAFDSTALSTMYFDNYSGSTYETFDMIHRPAHNTLGERLFLSMSDGIYRVTLPGGSYGSIAKYVNCNKPSYINIDTNYNIWFAYDDNKIGGVSGNLGSIPTSSFYNFELSGNNLTNDIIGGLVCDESGFVNILDKYDNVIYRVDISNPSNIFGVKILPEDNYIIINEGGIISEISATSAQPVDSLYAFGDWSGLSWQLKYNSSPSLSANVVVPLEGSSISFTIDSLENNYDIRRFNDSWDMKSQIKSYILPDYQKQFTDLWDDLIGNTVGDDSSEYQRFGRQFYEKISNFVLNHSDIDLSNINQVYSQFDILNENYENYNFAYPPDLYHWMNIFSIDYKRLKGTQYQCDRNFKFSKYADVEECEICGQIHETNLGDLILNPTMTIGETVVIRDTYLRDNAFDIFYPPISGSFEQLSGYGFRSPFVNNYEVYEYISGASSNNQSEGFINWIDENNKIQISGTNIVDWWKDNGFVENVFTQILYDKLGVGIDFITDVQSSQNYYISAIEELLAGETSLISGGVVSSEFFLPLKTKLCVPLTKYALPFYSFSETITSQGVEIMSSSEIISGVGASTGFVEFIFNGETYYAPVYEVDDLLLPIYGDGITFDSGVVIPEFILESQGFMIFERETEKILLPVYKAETT